MNKTKKSLNGKQPQNITAAMLILAGVVVFALTELLVAEKDKPLTTLICTRSSYNCSTDHGLIAAIIAFVLAIAGTLIVIGMRKYRHFTTVTSVIITIVLTAIFFYFVMAQSFVNSSIVF
ncbi:MAG: hypothetical protein ACMG55_09425 [Microcoleus sp.]